MSRWSYLFLCACLYGPPLLGVGLVALLIYFLT